MQIIIAASLVILAIVLFSSKKSLSNDALERASNAGGITATMVVLLTLAFYTSSIASKNQPATPTPKVNPISGVIATAAHLPTESALQSEDAQEVAPTGMTIVRLHPGDGDLPAMLVTESQKAVEFGQIPIVEFDATWCPPCKAIEKWLEAENESMLRAYSGTYIIKLDVDEWGWKDGGIQDFRFDGIPVYFKLDAEGRQTGEVIDGGAWNEDIPENIAPVMDEFFHGE